MDKYDLIRDVMKDIKEIDFWILLKYKLELVHNFGNRELVIKIWDNIIWNLLLTQFDLHYFPDVESYEIEEGVECDYCWHTHKEIVNKTRAIKPVEEFTEEEKKEKRAKLFMLIQRFVREIFIFFRHE
jgi:hypothetical protein